jgi:hypothetical protein
MVMKKSTSKPIAHTKDASSKGKKAQSDRMTAQAKSVIMKKSKATDSARRATKVGSERMTAQAKSIAAKKVKAQSAYSSRMTKPVMDKKKSDNAKSLAQRRNPVADYKTNKVRGEEKSGYLDIPKIYGQVLMPGGVSRGVFDDKRGVSPYSYTYKGKGSKAKKK